MTLDTQITLLQSCIDDGLDLHEGAKREMLKSLLRLRQISLTAPDSGIGTLASGRSLYTEAIDLYDKWHKEQLGVRMRMSAAEGKALKSILKYLTDSCEGNEQMALNTWQTLLSNWGKLNDFLKTQTSLGQINKYLTEIILKIKKHHAEAQRTDTAARTASILEDL